MSKRVLPARATALSQLIDYAGLFPPAGLGMAETVRNYAAYSKGHDAGLLGRLIVPASRLDEFEHAASETDAESRVKWNLSVLLGANAETEIAKAANFAESCQHAGGLWVTVQCIEAKISKAEDIQTLRKAMPAAWTVYFEIPVGSGASPLIHAAGKAGACAKMRTGGITADGFPSAEDISQFIFECARQKVPFKATAGLHHAIRSVNRFTYEKDSPSGWMHGFLNALLASGIANSGAPISDIKDLLDEEDAGAFRFEEDRVRWNSHFLSYEDLALTRKNLFTSFGSCSFTEPTSELHSLGIL